MKKKWISLLLFGLICFYCTAQTDGYKFYSKLDSVKTSGFYNIEVTPELSAHVKTDYSDLRVINSSNKWVPHILHVPQREYSGTALMMDLKFSISENALANTEILIEKTESVMSGFGLKISNTSAERFCTLSGSNDKNNWFVINDSILLQPVLEADATENIININFPPSSYSFYKIVIHNKNKDPFNIKSVVHNSVLSSPLKKIIDNPTTQLQQKDSGKISYIKIIQQQPYQFDNISMQLTGVKYYNRKVDLYIPYTDKHSYASPGQLLHSFTVSNNSTLTFPVTLSRSSVLYVLIYNQDNLPLTVKEVKTGYSNHYISTYLDSGVNYSLIMDNTDGVLADYDLSGLNSKLPDSIPYLRFGKITAFPEVELPVKTEKKNNWLLWSSIAAALLILLFFTYKMLTEVDKRKTI